VQVPIAIVNEVSQIPLLKTSIVYPRLEFEVHVVLRELHLIYGWVLLLFILRTLHNIITILIIIIIIIIIINLRYFL